MTDQADKLRALVGSTLIAADSVGDAALPMIVVTGARGGVGATTVAVNLAAVLCDRGERVLLVDATQHGGERVQPAGPRARVTYSLADVIAGKCDIRDAIVAGPAGVSMLLGCGRDNAKSGLAKSPRRISARRDGATNSDSRRAADRVVSELQSLNSEFDTVVVDAGHGLTPWSRRYWSSAKLNLLVTTAEDAVVLDAYATIKAAVAESMEAAVKLLVNQADSVSLARNAQTRIESACQRFLSRAVQALPALPRHLTNQFCVGRSAPRVWEIPNTPFGHAMLWLGRAVAEAVRGEVAYGAALCV